MKKFYYLLSIVCFSMFFLIIVSCEDDTEICDEGTTSRIILKFYNSTTNEASSFSGIISTNEYTDIKFSSKDSIFIPLTLTKCVDTIFYNTTDFTLKTDTIVLDFTREEEYVSKGCGVKINYKNTNATLSEHSNNTIKRIEFNPNLVDDNNQMTISDEEEAHMYIYF